MYWPGDTLIVSNVAREAQRVAHPCSIAVFLNQGVASHLCVYAAFVMVKYCFWDNFSIILIIKQLYFVICL